MNFLKHALASLTISGMALASTTALANEKAIIDLLVVYTQGTESAYSGQQETRFNHLVQTTNQIYADSGVDLEIRIAHSVKVNYSETNNAETALRDITYGQHNAFSQIAGLREVHNADMVVFYRPYANTHGSCGLAWVGGMGSNADFSAPYIKGLQYSHIAINQCGDYVTAHELGHNLGLRHSRRQDGSGGTTAYALGHGEDGLFTTIMAYQSAFNVDYWTGKVYKFSNPDISCKGRPCGVARGNNNSADASHTLNMTGPQVANFYGGANANFKTDLQAAYEELQAAETAYELAMQAVAESQALIQAYKDNLKAAKAALKAAKTAAKSSAKSLKKAVKQYEKYLRKANRAQEKAQNAYAKYESASKEKSRTNAYNKFLLQTQYQQEYSQLASQFLTQANQLAPMADSSTSVLESATQATVNAKQQLADEKAYLKTLKAEKSTAKKLFNSLRKIYNKLLKAAN